MTRSTTLRRRALVVTAVATLALAACSAPAEPEQPPAVTVTPTPQETRTAAPEPVVPEVPITWPLTGVEVDEVAERPSLAVKVENTSAARPQAGLEDADIVWETVVEFSVPRFIAVFHSKKPEKIGPIRSVRPMDATVIAPMGGMLAASGGQGGILRMVRDAGSQLLTNDAGDGGFYRSSERYAPHNVYSSAKDLWAQADDGLTAPPPAQFAYAEDAAGATAAGAGESTASISLRMGQGRPAWAWDAASGTWLRSEGSSDAVSEAGERLTAVNVVVLTVEPFDSGYNAQGGAMVPNLRLEGEKGKALVATGGKTIKARWTKGKVGKPIELVDADGEPLLLAPGNTWVELMPTNEGSYELG